MSLVVLNNDNVSQSTQVNQNSQGKDSAGRAIAKVIYGVGAVGFAALGVALLIKAVAFGVLTGAFFSAGIPQFGVLALSFTVGYGIGVSYTFDIAGHLFKEAFTI